MNLLQIIRLLYRNFILLIVSAIIMAVAVYLFADNLPDTYESNTTIYTGIGSGVNLEASTQGGSNSSGSSMAFDNLLNIVNSRETLEEVSLRLLAKHLLLDEADPKYISEKNYKTIMSMVPDDVINLVYGKNKTIKKQETDSSKSDTIDIGENTESNKNVEKQKKAIYHIVLADETLYSISRRYSIPLISLMRINNLADNNIRTGDKLIVSLVDEDIKTTPNLETKIFEDENNIYYIVAQTDNLSSIALKFNTSVKNLIIWNSLQNREIIAGQKLIVEKITDKSKVTDYSKDYKETITLDDELANFAKESSEAIKVREAIGQSSLENRLFEEFDTSYALEQTVKNFYAYKEKNNTNFIYGLLNYTYKHYSLDALQNISFQRLEKSNIIRISYESDDPGVCQYTLILLSRIFVNNYKLIRENQSDAVVQYFELQVLNANERLQRAEDELLRFNKDNNIINYYEQTKYIAAKKEDLESEFQKEKMNLASAEAAIKKMESRISSQSEINLNRTSIKRLRDELSSIIAQITYKETEDKPNFEEIRQLRKQADKLKNDLRNATSNEVDLSTTKEGIPLQQILTQWLESVIQYEESQAKLNVYGERRAEFESTYSTFAPLGAKLKRIEREINIAEQEYLSLLHSLNLSRLKQQDIELSSNIKPVGFPFYPISPKSKKKKLLVVAVFLVGFVLTFFILLLLSMFDSNINTTERASKFTKLALAGAYPFYPIKFGKVNYPFIQNRLTEIIIQDLKMMTSGDNFPKIIGLVSTKDQEGKSFLGHKIVDKIRESGDKTLFLIPKNSNEGELTSEHNDTVYYSPNIKFTEFTNITDFSPDISSLHSFRYLIIEFPSLILHSYPTEIIKKLNMTYVICKAKRIWSDADNKAIDTFKSLLKKEPKIFLNGTKLDTIETIISEIPKHRSKIRSSFKNLISNKAN